MTPASWSPTGRPSAGNHVLSRSTRRSASARSSRAALAALAACSRRAAWLTAAFGGALARRDSAFGTCPEHLVAHPNDAPVDRTRHAVLHFHVEFRKHEGLVHARITDVTLRGRVDDVPDLEALHGFIFRHAAGTIRAPDDRRVPATLLRPAVVAALGRHHTEGDEETGRQESATGLRPKQQRLEP